jgi:hypothetical protein
LTADNDKRDAASDDENRSLASKTGKEWLGREESWGEEGQDEEKEKKGGSDGDFAEVTLYHGRSSWGKLQDPRSKIQRSSKSQIPNPKKTPNFK